MFKTYSVSLKDAVRECADSETFQRRIKSGRYIFADSYFCLNAPEYIQRDADGTARLTAYALSHLDECCLTFTFGIAGGWACDQGIDSSTLGFVTSMPLRTPPRFFDDEGKARRHIASFKKIRDEVKSVHESLPRTFSGSLDELIKWRGVEEGDLARAVDLSTKTIRRLRTDESYSPTMETVMKLCIGLQLHPILSGHLLSTAGITFRPREPDITYQLLLSTYYTYSLDVCSQVLVELGLQPLNEDYND